MWDIPRFAEHHRYMAIILENATSVTLKPLDGGEQLVRGGGCGLHRGALEWGASARSMGTGLTP